MGGMEEPVIEKLRELGVQTKALDASETVSGVCESSRGVSKATQTANKLLIVKVKCNASIFTYTSFTHDFVEKEVPHTRTRAHTHMHPCACS